MTRGPSAMTTERFVTRSVTSSNLFMVSTAWKGLLLRSKRSTPLRSMTSNSPTGIASTSWTPRAVSCPESFKLALTTAHSSFNPNLTRSMAASPRTIVCSGTSSSPAPPPLNLTTFPSTFIVFLRTRNKFSTSTQGSPVIVTPPTLLILSKSLASVSSSFVATMQSVVKGNPTRPCFSGCMSVRHWPRVIFLRNTISPARRLTGLSVKSRQRLTNPWSTLEIFSVLGIEAARAAIMRQLCVRWFLRQ